MVPCNYRCKYKGALASSTVLRTCNCTERKSPTPLELFRPQYILNTEGDRHVQPHLKHVTCLSIRHKYIITETRGRRGEERK